MSICERPHRHCSKKEAPKKFMECDWTKVLSVTFIKIPSLPVDPVTKSALLLTGTGL